VSAPECVTSGTVNRVLFGDCRDTLKTLADDGVRVQCCVTSPPYYGLRDYKCDGQIGLEDTPEEYVSALVGVFRLVRDVLSDDGTLWLNLGDSYVANASNQVPQTKSHKGSGFAGANRNGKTGLKSKDLIGIPWRVAFALQADGWYLRQDIIWAKPNPMPESVTDRCTKAHEYLFLLSKQAAYYYDAEAIQEAAAGGGKGMSSGLYSAGTGTRNDQGRHLSGGFPTGETRNRRSVWTIASEPCALAHFAVMPRALVEPCILAGSRVGDIVLDPFIGSGTVGQVAQDLGRRWIGCELQQDYEPLQQARTAQQALDLPPRPAVPVQDALDLGAAP
jgi:DNA modification methylase